MDSKINKREKIIFLLMLVAFLGLNIFGGYIFASTEEFQDISSKVNMKNILSLVIILSAIISLLTFLFTSFINNIILNLLSGKKVPFWNNTYFLLIATLAVQIVFFSIRYFFGGASPNDFLLIVQSILRNGIYVFLIGKRVNLESKTTLILLSILFAIDILVGVILL
ncbi:hypothetical protein AALA52_04315 [Lactococcus ileimucosae]|uniref:Uncharacterized protein n=1 Tax=Lactococcus ileimucosae TaxID=2941329 RepID=A0ABV4D580_9LACT